MDLTDLIPGHAPTMRAKMPAAYWRNPSASYSGRIYGLPPLLPLSAWRVAIYRKDFLDASKMGPQVALEDYLVIFAKAEATDLNRNGQADETPYGARKDSDHSDLPWGSFGVHPSTWRIRYGTIVPELIAPQMKEALDLWRTPHQQGYVNYDMFTNSGMDWQKDINSEKAMFWNHDTMNSPTTWWADEFPKEAVLDVLPGPKDSAGTTPPAPQSDAFGSVRVVNAKTKDPATVLRFYNWMWSDDLEREGFFSFGIKGYNYTEEGGKIAFDALAPQNIDTNAVGFIPTLLSTSPDCLMNPPIIELYPNRDLIKKAISAAAQSTFPHASKNMPVLDAIAENPSLEAAEASAPHSKTT